MKVYLIGAGCGAGSLTREAKEAIAGAGLVLGPERLLREHAGDRPGAKAVRAADIAAAIEASACGSVCVLLSGDSGFYSGTKRLLPLLEGRDVRVLPGVSSVQVLAARLGRSWQDWRLCSAHGAECDAVAAVCGGAPAFFLTGGADGPAVLCRQLVEAGLGGLSVTVGEDLGTASERITRGTAETFSDRTFTPLNVMLAEAAPRMEKRSPGFPDELFRRTERVPMTKQEVRAAALSKLAVGPEAVCWDIGAGTGSVSIELAMQAKAVYGVERSAQALELAEENRRALGAWNLRLVPGAAPEALAGLPAPDAVFVGGSGGRMTDILRAVYAANPNARVCVSVIALESLHNTLSALADLGLEAEVAQLAVSRSRAVAGLHMMTALNPVYLVTGVRP